jgi:hypothetical protein
MDDNRPDTGIRHGTAAPARPHSARAEAVGLLVLALAFVWTYRGLIGQDTTDHVPILTVAADDSRPVGGFAALVDQRFVVWLLSRNARTWLSSPTRLFEGEICHPAPNGLALGEPALTQGLLGVPGWLASHDPIFTYDSVVLAVTALAALAMYALMLGWTGMPIAATVAALAYAFHPLKLMDPVHLYIADTAWLVFALLFYRRWLEAGRWRDALCLAGACALQIGGSLYPLLAALAIGVPFAIWGAWRIGVRRTSLPQWLVVALLIGAAGFAAFAPFLAKVSTGELAERSFQVFVPWTAMVSGNGPTLGWGLIALACAAFIPLSLPFRNRDGAPDPRWSLLAGLVVVLWLATGGNQVALMEAAAAEKPLPIAIPNLFSGLASVLPGLGVVRAPGAIAHGSYLVLALLAGLGTRRLLTWLPDRAASVLGWSLVAIMFVDILRPGLPGALPLSTWEFRPPEGKLAFFAELEAAGNAGPIVELPSPSRPHPVYGLSILTSAYHFRPTSRCHNSFVPPETLQAEEVSRELPSPDAIRALREMGFTTVVLHEDVLDPRAPDLRERFEEAAQEPGSGLRFVHRGGALSAWGLDEPAARD